MIEVIFGRRCDSPRSPLMNKGRRLKKARPFWLPASTFYFLAAAVAIGVFFLVWAILGEARDESPWIAAGLMASVSMIAAVVVREVVLRSRRNSVFLAQRRLDNSILSAAVPARREEDPDKLTLERNSIWLEEVKRKSEAAMVLGRLAESHREVFELCAEYLELVRRELPTVGVGSPRLAAITRGRDKVERIHRRHMLKWAEIEIKNNTQAALESDRRSVRIGSAGRALSAVTIAFEYYPDEPEIVRTKDAVEDFAASVYSVEALERAKRAEESGDLNKALACTMEAERFALQIVGAAVENPLENIRNDIKRLSKMLEG